MKVIKENTTECSFKDIKIGTVFEYEDDIYIKCYHSKDNVDNYKNGLGDSANALCILPTSSCGELFSFNDDDLCIPYYDSELIIK